MGNKNQVETVNPSYAKYYAIWLKNRDAEEGSDAVKSKGEVYLPKSSGWDKEYYDNYKKRAVYYNFVSRTINALKGMLFRKSPMVTLPPELEYCVNNVTKDGQGIVDFAQSLVSEIINPSRVGVLVDYPSVDTSDMSIAQAEELNIRPYLSMYKAETIINWRTSVINNKEQLSLVVLKETYDVIDPNNRFDIQVGTRYRVLDLTDGIYSVTIYNHKDELIDSVIPLVNSESLNYIPFYIFNQNGLSNNISTSPLMNDLTDVNLAHYKNSADNENALHWSGVRTIVVKGWPEGKALEMGTVLTTPAETEVSFLIAPAEDALTSAMDKKQEIMATLGANLIVSKANTSATTATSTLIQHQGETSEIQEIGLSVSRELTNILNIMYSWASNSDIIDNQVTFKINTDFNPKGLTGSEALAFSQMVLNGTMSQEVLDYNLLKGEVLAPNMENKVQNVKPIVQ